MQMPRSSVARGLQHFRGLAPAVLVILSLLLFPPGEALAQDTGSLAGKITPTQDRDFVQSTARIPDLGVVVEVAGDGTFRFDDLRPGSYLLEVRVPNLGIVAERVSIRAGEETSVVIELKAGSHSEEIVVSASAEARSPLELASPTTSLSGLQLDLRLESSLGESSSTTSSSPAWSWSSAVAAATVAPSAFSSSTPSSKRSVRRLSSRPRRRSASRCSHCRRSSPARSPGSWARASKIRTLTRKRRRAVRTTA